MTGKITETIQSFLNSGVTSREQYLSVAHGSQMTKLLKEIRSIPEFEIFSRMQRLGTFEAINSAYRIGSNAAHTGKLKRAGDVEELNKASVVVKRALLKIIDHGSINWKSVELGLYEPPQGKGS